MARGDFLILEVLICALWCVGILGLVWVLAGWFLLPLAGKQMTVLFPSGADGALERQLRTIEWLRAAGLSKGEVIVLCDDLDDTSRREAALFAEKRFYIQILTRAQFCAIIRMETNDDEAGRTDDPRHGAERAVSESGKRL